MKDSSKNKEWERRRRDRLNDAFKKLAQILPNHDPAKLPPKIDILEKATQFIKELRLSNSRLSSQQTHNDEKSKLITELQDESNKLILRVKQLTTLLKQAKIRIPLGPSLKLGKKPGKWSNQLTPENVENSTKHDGDQNQNTVTKSASKEETINKEKDTISNDPSSISLTTQITPTPSVNGTPLKETNADASVNANVTTGTGVKSVPPENVNISPTIIKPVPLQTTTIILTACPIPNPLAQSVVTRMAISPRILPKPTEGSQLQKIAILPIRKPLPPKEKKRRNRGKKIKQVTTTNDVAKSSALPVVPSSEKIGVSNETDVAKCTKKSDKTLEKNSETSNNSKENNKNDAVRKIPEVIDLTDDKSHDGSSVSGSNNNNSKKINDNKITSVNKKMEDKLVEKVGPNSNSPSKESDNLPISLSGQPIISEESIALVSEVPEVSGEEAEKILRNDSIIDAVSEAMDISSEQQSFQKSDQPKKIDLLQQENEFSAINTEKSTKKQNEPSVEQIQLEERRKEKVVTPVTDTAPSNSLRENEQSAMEISENETNIPSNENDKISECIARSIDLIDPPVGELMELSGDWGEAHSPKSPISPTQMFLSMFPLLPRESIVSASEAQNATGKHSGQFSSVRSSFFIDAMLPEDNSINNETESSNNATSNPNSSTSTNTINPSNSSSFMSSSYNSLVGSTCLAVAPTSISTPPRQEPTHFHNLDTLNSISAVPPSSNSSASSNAKKSTNTPVGNFSHQNPNRVTEAASKPLFTSANPVSSISNQIVHSNANAATISSSDTTTHYKSHHTNFDSYSLYSHSQLGLDLQANQHQSSNTGSTIQTQPSRSNQKKPNQVDSIKNNSIPNISPSSHIRTTSVSTPATVLQTVSPVTSSVIPLSRTQRSSQPQPTTFLSDAHSHNITSTTTCGHKSIPVIPAPIISHHHQQHLQQDPMPISHLHHHSSSCQQQPTSCVRHVSAPRNFSESSKNHSAQNYPNSSNQSKNHAPQNYHNSSESSKNHPPNQTYPNAFVESSTSNNHPNPPPPTTNANQKHQKPQIFRPGLTDFNMSTRMHANTSQPQEPPTPQHSQNYSPHSVGSDNTNPNRHSKSLSSTSVSYPTPIPISHQNSSNLHNQQYTMQSQSNNNTENQVQPQSKSHSHSSNTSSTNSNSSKQLRQYSQNNPEHSNANNNNSYQVCPPQSQQSQPQNVSYPPPPATQHHSSKSQSQNRHPQQTHSQRSSNQSQQQHSSSRQPNGKTTVGINSNNNLNSSSSNILSSTENYFHLDFSSAIPSVPISIPPQTLPPPPPPLSSRSKSNTFSQPTSAIPVAPIPHIPDFTSASTMNFNQYSGPSHHNPHHSNYLPTVNTPVSTPQRITPFYLPEVHPPEVLPIVAPHPTMNPNTNPIIHNHSQHTMNFNPPVTPSYCHPTNSHQNKNYFLDPSQGHSLYHHSLSHVSQAHHIPVEIPPAPPPPTIYSQPLSVHTAPHVSNRHQQNCHLPVSGGLQTQQNPPPQNISRQQQQPQNNKSHNNKQSSQIQNQNHYPVQQQQQQHSNNNTNNINNSNSNNNSVNAVANSNSHPQQQQRHNSSANANANTVSSSNPIAVTPQTNSSSRPVNWMTDPPHRKPPPVKNPFSVSKLVGNSSFVTNNSYCAEALIRKNPDWNDFHFTPSTPLPVPPPQHSSHSHPPHTFVPYQAPAQNEHPGYSNFTQYPPHSNPSGTHFSHFDHNNHQQQHHQHHNQHHPPHHSGPSTTSSVSNFNLSSIFPEINDKRNNSSTNTSTANTNVQESPAANRCNYYSGKHAK